MSREEKRKEQRSAANYFNGKFGAKDTPIMIRLSTTVDNLIIIGAIFRAFVRC